jgi:hypothetical protein
MEMVLKEKLKLAEITISSQIRQPKRIKPLFRPQTIEALKHRVKWCSGIHKADQYKNISSNK